VKRGSSGGRRRTSNPPVVTEASADGVPVEIPAAAAPIEHRLAHLQAELKAAHKTIDVLIARTERRALEPSQAELFEVAARMEQQIERRTRELEDKRAEFEAQGHSFDGERALEVTAPPLLGDHDARLRAGESLWTTPR